MLRQMLSRYYQHVQQHDHTMLTKFYGLHRVKPHRGSKVCTSTCQASFLEVLVRVPRHVLVLNFQSCDVQRTMVRSVGQQSHGFCVKVAD